MRGVCECLDFSDLFRSVASQYFKVSKFCEAGRGGFRDFQTGFLFRDGA